jgi:DNA-directed RNA polymerase subunit RPC12/RpoP
MNSMPKLGTLLRRCPSCGHRFHVKLVSEGLLSDKKTEEPISRDEPLRIGTGGYQGGIPRGRGYTPTMVHEEGTLTTDIKEFEDSYKCGRCGHQWSEKREEESESTH